MQRWQPAPRSFAPEMEAYSFPCYSSVFKTLEELNAKSPPPLMVCQSDVWLKDLFGVPRFETP